ncbi:MAG: very short patch repair endonuclease [Firmicutes bacterium]|nr:very short patch repair endonuclease [Bacillota bacterium]
MDFLTPERRSRLMARVRGKNTRVEWRVRHLVYTLGYRYRLHVDTLPGTPDLVFPGRKAVVFVHGCFWHRHHCRRGRIPKSRCEFWSAKLERNVERDRYVRRQLEADGWRVMVVWECETLIRDTSSLTQKIIEFLGPSRSVARVSRR